MLREAPKKKFRPNKFYKLHFTLQMCLSLADSGISLRLLSLTSPATPPSIVGKLLAPPRPQFSHLCNEEVQLNNGPSKRNIQKPRFYSKHESNIQKPRFYSKHESILKGTLY